MIRLHWRFTSKISLALNTGVICIWHGMVYLVITSIIFLLIVDLIFRKKYIFLWHFWAASFGGIFGLCLGGSVISLVELLYFYTLRLYSVFINRGKTCSKYNDSKRVSISNNVKSIEINPKSFLQNLKAYQQFERYPRWHRMRPSIFGPSSGVSETFLNKTRIHEFNKPAVGEFLK